MSSSRSLKPYVECEEDAAEDEREKVEAGTFQASRTYSSLNVAGMFCTVRTAAPGLSWQLQNSNSYRRAAEYGRRHKNIPKQLVAIGFSTSDSSLFLGDGEEGVGFDTEGIQELDRGTWAHKELPKNFLPDFRQTSLTVFDTTRFKCTAVVMLGSAPESTRASARTKLLKQRQEKVAAEVKRAKRPSKWDNGDANPALSPEELEAEVQKAVDAVEVTEEDEKAWLEEIIDEQHENELARSFEKFAIPSEEEGFQDTGIAGPRVLRGSTCRGVGLESNFELQMIILRVPS
eukprot:s1868_g10.t1